MTSELSAIIQANIKQEFDEEEQRSLESKNEEELLLLLLGEYKAQVGLANEYSQEISTENCQLKTQLLSLQEKLALKPKQDASSSPNLDNSQLNPSQTSSKEYDLLFSQLTKLEEEKLNLIQETEEYEKKLLEQSEKLSTLGNQNYGLKKELESLRHNEGDFKQENHGFQKEIEGLKQKHEADKKKYEKTFIADFQQLLATNQSKEKDIRIAQKGELQSQLLDCKGKLKIVIEKVNSIFAISLIEEDVETWVRKFSKEADKYEAEIKAILPDRVKNKSSFIMNMAQLQKEKIAASKMQLRNILNQSK